MTTSLAKTQSTKLVSLSKKQQQKLQLFREKGIENLVMSHELIPMKDGTYKLIAMKDKDKYDGLGDNKVRTNDSYNQRMYRDSISMTPDEQKLFFLDGECNLDPKEVTSCGSCCLY